MFDNMAYMPYTNDYHEGQIILTNGFIKKTQKTPIAEIKLAKSRRNDFLERIKRDEDIKRI